MIDPLSSSVHARGRRKPDILATAVDEIAAVVKIAGVHTLLARATRGSVRRLVLITLLLLPPAVLGCGGPTFIVAQYDGPVRPREAIAIIQMHGSDAVQLVSVDGEPLAPIADDVRLQIELLPGEHSVGVANMARPEQPAQRVRFLAEAGKLYAAAWTTAGNPRVLELQPSSGAPIRDVSMTIREAPPNALPSVPSPQPPAQQPGTTPAPPAAPAPEPSTLPPAAPLPEPAPPPPASAPSPEPAPPP